MEEPVAEENHHGEEPELEGAAREEKPGQRFRKIPRGWWIRGVEGNPAGWRGEGLHSLGFGGGPRFVGADDEEGEEDGEEATAGRGNKKE